MKAIIIDILSICVGLIIGVFFGKKIKKYIIKIYNEKNKRT